MSVEMRETRAARLRATQPLPAPAPGTEASQDSDALQKAQHDLLRPTCPRCGLLVPENRLRSASPTQSRAPGSEASAHSGAKDKDRSRSKRGGAGSHQAAPTPADSCFQLLLACLWCRFSAALLGLLEACSSCCLQGLCSPCCHGCARCCSAIQDTPAEELSCPAHCHSVLFESCCEPTECLEFCLDCCEICHRS
ncbi:myoD family inhibitor domain-containing protein-like [Fundulus diaphanus]